MNLKLPPKQFFDRLHVKMQKARLSLRVSGAEPMTQDHRAFWHHLLEIEYNALVMYSFLNSPSRQPKRPRSKRKTTSTPLPTPPALTPSGHYVTVNGKRVWSPIE